MVPRTHQMQTREPTLQAGYQLPGFVLVGRHREVVAMMGI